MAVSHVVLLPVKPPAWGKSRLGELPDAARRDLAEAFALDTLQACLDARGVDAVLVLTDDPLLATTAVTMGAAAIPDGSTWGMNEALRLGAAEAARRWPDARPAAVCADLPALVPADLDAALAAAAAGSHFVADAERVGTTLYVADAALFAPEFGEDSRLAHRDGGALEITEALPTLRRDVDDVEDLRAAIALGVGPHTAAVLERIAFL